MTAVRGSTTAAPPGTIPTISFSDVLRGRFPARAVRGRVVVVGAAAPTLRDVHPTPAAGDELDGRRRGAGQRDLDRPARDPAAHRAALAVALLLVVLLALGGAAGRMAPPRSRGGAGGAARGAGLPGRRAAGLRRRHDHPWSWPRCWRCWSGAVALIAWSQLSERRARLDGPSATTRCWSSACASAPRSCGRPSWRSCAGWAGPSTGATARRASTWTASAGSASGWGWPRDGRRRRPSCCGTRASLHDVGKVGIPDRILDKPGPLDADEWEVMKTHTTIGASILEGSESELMVLARSDRADPPRALGRHGLSRRPAGRGDPTRGPDLRHLRRVRRPALAPALQGPVGAART